MRNIIAQLTVGYTLFTGIELNNIYVSCKCREVTVCVFFFDPQYVTLVSTVPLTFLTGVSICQSSHIATQSRKFAIFFLQLLMKFPYLILGN